MMRNACFVLKQRYSASVLSFNVLEKGSLKNRPRWNPKCENKMFQCGELLLAVSSLTPPTDELHSEVRAQEMIWYCWVQIWHLKRALGVRKGEEGGKGPFLHLFMQYGGHMEKLKSKDHRQVLGIHQTARKEGSQFQQEAAKIAVPGWRQ